VLRGIELIALNMLAGLRLIVVMSACRNKKYSLHPMSSCSEGPYHPHG
jgi:hypothetical protein